MRTQTLSILMLVASSCRPQIDHGEESYRDNRNPISITVPEQVQEASRRAHNAMSAADLRMSMSRGDHGLVIDKPSGLFLVHDNINTPLSFLKSGGVLPDPFTVSIFIHGDAPTGQKPEVAESRLRSIATNLSAHGASKVTFVGILPLGYLAVIYELPEHAN